MRLSANRTYYILSEGFSKAEASAQAEATPTPMHFTIMGDQYKLNDPNPEEEIWIPIEIKNKL